MPKEILCLVTIIMMDSVKVTFNSVAALLNAEKHFPIKTPRRWQLVAEYVKKSCILVSDNGEKALQIDEPSMVVGCSKSFVNFDYSAEHCKHLFNLISKSHKHMLSYQHGYESIVYVDHSLSAFKPLVLVPRILKCCGHAVTIK